MKFRLGISILFLSLFVALPANRAWACGSDEAGHAAKFHRVHASETASGHAIASSAHCAEVQDVCGPLHAGQDCPPDPDNCGHCHCPGCGQVPTGPSGGLPNEGFCLSHLNRSNDAATRQAFYFAERQPETVCLSIWQPPKLDA